MDLEIKPLWISYLQVNDFIENNKIIETNYDCKDTLF